jgi:hypothetical protein
MSSSINPYGPIFTLYNEREQRTKPLRKRGYDYTKTHVSSEQNTAFLALVDRYGIRLQNPSVVIPTSNNFSMVTPILYGHVMEQN